MVMLIQVPLKQKSSFANNLGAAADSAETLMAPTASSPLARSRSDVEAAVIGHGATEGPFTEIDNLDIERDPNFPIRVTVQFYKATSNGIVSAEDMAEIDQQIKRIYDDADYVGSLVTDGRAGRPTHYVGEHSELDDWWEAFWQRSQNRLNSPRAGALDLLRRLRGQY